MPDLPAPGSEWIRRSKLDEWTVWNSGPDGVYLRNIDGGSIGVRAENFHRDFIEQGPVTLERLEACGWERDGNDRAFLAIFPDEDCEGLFWSADGLELCAGRHELRLQCPDMLGVLWAMRLFVTH